MATIISELQGEIQTLRTSLAELTQRQTTNETQTAAAISAATAATNATTAAAAAAAASGTNNPSFPGRPARTTPAKIGFFRNLPGENFLAWRSQFNIVALLNQWGETEAKFMAYTYMRDCALEAVQDIKLNQPDTLEQLLDKYQNRFLPSSKSQMLRAQFAVVSQLPNESVQKLHARMRAMYHLAYPNQYGQDETFLIERFISALNKRDVQNFVRRRKPKTYDEALEVANEETGFVLLDDATHTPGGIQQPTPSDTSFIATLRNRPSQNSAKGPSKDKQCYYCGGTGHFKDRCSLRLKDYLQKKAKGGPLRFRQDARRSPQKPARTTLTRTSQMAEAHQTTPTVTEGYGKVATIADEDAGEDILDEVDLSTMDDATISALFDEMQIEDDEEDPGQQEDFSNGQQ